MLTPKNGLDPKVWNFFEILMDVEPDRITVRIDRKLSWKRKREKVMEKDFYFD